MSPTIWARRRNRLWCGLVFTVVPILGIAAQSSRPTSDELLAAVARGDVDEVTALIGRGADVNAPNSRGVTALYVAADRANLPLVRLLIERRADVNAYDLEGARTPLRVASVPWSDVKAEEARAQIVRLLIEKGAGREGEALTDLIRGGHIDAAQTLVELGEVDQSYLNAALEAARGAGATSLVEALTKAGATSPRPIDAARSPERLRLLVGVYRNDAGDTITLLPGANEDELLLERAGRPLVTLLPADLLILRSHDLKTVLRLKPRSLPPTTVFLTETSRRVEYRRAGDARLTTAARSSAPAARRAAVSATRARTTAAVPVARDWPSFRGNRGSGVADGAHPPDVWDVEKDVNIRWKTPIPGLAHSSPVVWGDRVFVTTAVPTSTSKPLFRHGEDIRAGVPGGGGVVASTPDGPHSWRVYALDKGSGKILWSHVAHEGIPRTERHVMQSQADATPVTDGTHLVVSFGSEGLYCYDLNGRLLWKRDLGPLPSGFAVDHTYEWATASSPVIYKGLVILQMDLLKSSSVAAFDLRTGNEVWRVHRDEIQIPSWATPLLYEDEKHVELVTVATAFARGYDPATGKELWRLGRHSTYPIPAPVAGRGLIYLTSGSGSTIQPIYALRAGARGDITLKENQVTNEFVAWSKTRGGPFIPTPVLYGDILYVSSNTGILAAYHADTGERLYQERLTTGGSYSASGVAADGKLYFASEEGEVIVVKAGPTFERIAINKVGELIMATPAIVPGMILFRTQHHVVAVAESESTSHQPRGR